MTIIYHSVLCTVIKMKFTFILFEAFIYIWSMTRIVLQKKTLQCKNTLLCNLQHILTFNFWCNAVACLRCDGDISLCNLFEIKIFTVVKEFWQWVGLRFNEVTAMSWLTTFMGHNVMWFTLLSTWHFIESIIHETFEISQRQQQWLMPEHMTLQKLGELIWVITCVDLVYS